MVGGFTMDMTGNDTPWEGATAAMTHVLSRITTLHVRLLGFIFLGGPEMEHSYIRDAGNGSCRKADGDHRRLGSKSAISETTD